MIFLYLSIIINIQEPLQTTGMLCIEDSYLWIELSKDTLAWDEDYFSGWYPIETTICNIKGIVLKSITQDKNSNSTFLTFEEYVRKILGDKALITYIFVELHTKPPLWKYVINKEWEHGYWNNCLYIGYYLGETK